MTEEAKKKLRELAERGGDDALLPQVLLELVESAEKSGEGDKDIACQISELSKLTTNNAEKADKRFGELETLHHLRPIWRWLLGKK